MFICISSKRSCTGCDESISESVPKDSEKRFKSPFKCFFCRAIIGYSTTYFRMVDPRGGTNSWNGAKKIVYLHTDGAACVGKPMPSDADAACAGGCGQTTADEAIFDVMGVGNAAHLFCKNCKYKRRAGVLAGAQDFMESDGIRCETGGREDGTPRKRPRTDE